MILHERSHLYGDSFPDAQVFHISEHTSFTVNSPGAVLLRVLSVLRLQIFSEISLILKNGGKFTLSSVRILMTLAPQFSARVLGITSRAFAMALYVHCCTPCMLLLFPNKAWDMAISTAPPPGTKRASKRTFLATFMASRRFLSVSFKTSLLAPLNKTVQAFGSLQSSKKAKYLTLCSEKFSSEIGQNHSLVSDLSDLEKSTSSSDITLLDLICSVDDGRAARSSDTVVVCLSGSSERGDVVLQKMVLGEIFFPSGL